jgi:hypothetical protein
MLGCSMGRVLSLCCLVIALGSCGGADAEPEEPKSEFDWLTLETGTKCAMAEVACAPGNCAAKVRNACKTPVTCDLHIECICRAMTGEEGPATATSGETTILAGNDEGIAAKVICEQGDVLATIARTIRCF